MILANIVAFSEHSFMVFNLFHGLLWIFNIQQFYLLIEKPEEETLVQYSIKFTCQHYCYVALRNPVCMNFLYYLGSSPPDWRTMIHWDMVLTIFHNEHICQGLSIIVKTTFLCIAVLQLRGEGPEKLNNHGTNQSHTFTSFHDLLPGIEEQQYFEM